jgi:oligopeptide/dipeptide ABC transporter ATP-binding protein
VAIISVKGLSVDYITGPWEKLHALRSVNLEIAVGESTAIVGESGCGKTTLAYSLLKLGPKNSVLSGDIVIDGVSIGSAKGEQLRGIRGKTAAMIFQDPGESLNPVFTVFEQIKEAVYAHTNPIPEAGAMRLLAQGLLKNAGLDDTGRILNSYPHQLSGGQQQRVMIAIALSCAPKILVADEPTTALDVTVQAQIIKLLVSLKKEHNLTLVLITHDLNVAVMLCKRVVVMYAGEIVEDGMISGIARAAHPYTHALFDIIPDMHSGNREFRAIPGSVPDLRYPPAGCSFEPRCPRAREKCKRTHPEMGGGVRCFFPYETRRME